MLYIYSIQTQCTLSSLHDKLSKSYHCSACKYHLGKLKHIQYRILDMGNYTQRRHHNQQKMVLCTH